MSTPDWFLLFICFTLFLLFFLFFISLHLAVFFLLFVCFHLSIFFVLFCPPLCLLFVFSALREPWVAAIERQLY
jgi:hypothetical protein